MNVSRQPAAGATSNATASAMSAPTAYREKITPPAPIARRLAGHASTVYGTPTASSPGAPEPGEEAQGREQPGAAATPETAVVSP